MSCTRRQILRSGALAMPTIIAGTGATATLFARSGLDLPGQGGGASETDLVLRHLATEALRTYRAARSHPNPKDRSPYIRMQGANLSLAAACASSQLRIAQTELRRKITDEGKALVTQQIIDSQANLAASMRTDYDIVIGQSRFDRVRQLLDIDQRCGLIECLGTARNAVDGLADRLSRSSSAETGFQRALDPLNRSVGVRRQLDPIESWGCAEWNLFADMLILDAGFLMWAGCVDLSIALGMIAATIKVAIDVLCPPLE